MKIKLMCILALLLIGTLGCEKKGSNEKVGERIDDIVDNVKHGDAPLKDKGTMEKLGESIDDSINNNEKKLN